MLMQAEAALHIKLIYLYSTKMTFIYVVQFLTLYSFQNFSFILSSGNQASNNCCVRAVEQAALWLGTIEGYGKKHLSNSKR